jgi:hypothetical protein
VTANNGKSYLICVPFSFINSITGKIKVYAWPLFVKVIGGTLERYSLNFSVAYKFISDGSGDTGNGGSAICENKTVKANNGISYIVCVPFGTVGGSRIYAWPSEIKVSGGILNRFDIGTDFGYTFTPTVVDTENGNGSGNGKDEIIPGVDNSFLIIGAIGLFLILS